MASPLEPSAGCSALRFSAKNPVFFTTMSHWQFHAFLLIFGVHFGAFCYLGNFVFQDLVLDDVIGRLLCAREREGAAL